MCVYRCGILDVYRYMIVICWLVCGSHGNTFQCTGGGDHCMLCRMLSLDDADPLNPAHCTCGSLDEQLLCRDNGNLSDAPLSGHAVEVGDELCLTSVHRKGT